MRLSLTDTLSKGFIRLLPRHPLRLPPFLGQWFSNMSIRVTWTTPTDSLTYGMRESKRIRLVLKFYYFNISSIEKVFKNLPKAFIFLIPVLLTSVQF